MFDPGSLRSPPRRQGRHAPLPPAGPAVGDLRPGRPSVASVAGRRSRCVAKAAWHGTGGCENVTWVPQPPMDSYWFVWFVHCANVFFATHPRYIDIFKWPSILRQSRNMGMGSSHRTGDWWCFPGDDQTPGGPGEKMQLSMTSLMGVGHYLICDICVCMSPASRQMLCWI